MSQLVHAVGSIFQPILKLIAGIMAFFYAIIPSYPVAVGLLTIVVMAALTPLTVKSTKNMAAMQALGPEMKKLQQKYKGPENRVQLNEEMMKLYKEHNVNPASGCLPMLLQMPFFFMLYSVIRGITTTVGKGAKLPYSITSSGVNIHQTSVCHVSECAVPRYISPSTKMYHDIVAAHGKLLSGGIDFAAKLLSHHASPWAYVPYAILVLGAVGLQYLQMARLNARNPQAAQANPQAAMLQKYMPLIFGFIYLNVAAILNVYFIVSSAIRIGTQEVLFRRGMVPGPNSPPPASGGKQRTSSSSKDSGTDSSERALPKSTGPKTAGPKTSGSKSSGTGNDAKDGAPKASGGGSGTNGATPSTNGNKSNSNDGSGSEGAAKKHPRSKAKKERKAR
jgi:YidC/Oxa1 family membrane protein insertase